MTTASQVMTRRCLSLIIPVACVSLPTVWRRRLDISAQWTRRCRPVTVVLVSDNCLDTCADYSIDFYQYSCGGWVKTHDIPADRSRTSVFDKVSEDNIHAIREVLESKPDSLLTLLAEHGTQVSPADTNLLNKTISLYESCMDERRIKEAGVEPLLRLIKDVNSTINAYTSRLERKDTLSNEAISQILVKLHLMGVDALIGVGVSSDAAIPEIQTIYLGQAGLGLPSKEFYDQPDYLVVYTKAIADMFSLLFPTIQLGTTGNDVVLERFINATSGISNVCSSFDQLLHDNFDNHQDDNHHHRRRGGQHISPPHRTPAPHPPNPIDWATLAAEMVAFEKKLASISWGNEDLSSPTKTYNQYTLATLDSLIPDFPWKKFLTSLIDSTKTHVSLTKLEGPIVVTTPSYFIDLAQLLKSTNAQTLQTYLIWQVILEYALFLDKESREPLDPLKEKVYGIKAGTESPRWETCVRVVDSAMGFSAGKWFVEKHFAGNSREEARNIVSNILDAFVERLDGIEWLDDKTRGLAKDKVKNLERKIGYPDFIQDANQLARYYEDLIIKRENYFDNVISHNLFEANRNWHRLEKPTDKTEWGMYPQTVNAYYNPIYNEIVFPAGILQPPFFKATLPEYLNYGAIGVVAGHELCHAFDNNGRQFDARGRLVNWWPNSTAKEFEARTKCFEEQYSSFTILDPNGAKVHINGRLTLGENLADNGGLKQSWAAWNKKRHDRQPDQPARNDTDNHGMSEMRLPGLHHLSEEQLFFVGFSQVWCGKARPEYALNAVRVDPHSPAFVRVNAAVQNSEEFAKAFQCKKNDKMNPEKKCLLW